MPCSCLDGVLALEHVVDFRQVVSAGNDAVGLALRSVVLLQVGLLAEVAHLRHHCQQTLALGRFLVALLTWS